ncbi:MAG: hypothetical protein H6702_09125 [Myxococcales bacterium]|nr:hypothetical protein [Myxococcales bacterium]
MGRLAAFAVAFGLSAAAWAHPCEGPLPPTHTALFTRLDAAGPADWPAVLAEAQAAAAEGTPAARACAHYVAGSAAFFLSRPAADRAHHAWQAVRHLVTAQALAPAAMAEKRAAARLDNAWARVPDAPGWPAAAGARPVTLNSPGGTVRLAPPLDGEAPIELELPAGSHRLTLRPGPWRLGRVGRCAAPPQGVTLGGGAVAVPGKACPVTLTVTDDGAAVDGVALVGPEGPIPVEGLRGGGTVTVQAPGYLAARVALPAEGGPIQVALRRCPVSLEVTTEPPGVPLAGAGPGPWGPRTVTLWPEGPHPAPVAVAVPRPTGCADARHAARITAPHPLTAQGLDGTEAPVAISRLVVAQQAVDPAGFHLPPGRHVYQATAPGLGLTLGQFVVPTCGDPRGCAPLPLEVRWRRTPGGPARAAAPDGPGPQITLAVGGLIAAGGLVAGAQALATQRDIDGYTSPAVDRRRLDDLFAERDDQALTADVLLGIGLTTAAVGLVWFLLR